MSDDRHLNVENGAMGNLFRRATLAALGLDALDDVSQQSFDVIERADAFVGRLLGNISGVLPKRNFDHFGAQTASLADEILDGMAGLNGPASATDLGDWQYWLDAALLMLFDEDEEVGVAQSKAAAQKAQKKQDVVKRLEATPQEVRDRIVALKKAGVTPAMIQGMPQAQRRALLSNTHTASKQNSSISTEALVSALQERAKTSVPAMQIAVEKILAQTSRQVLASRVFDNVLALTSSVESAPRKEFAFAADMMASAWKTENNGASLAIAMPSGNVSSEMAHAVARWTRAVEKMRNLQGGDLDNAREVLTSLDELERTGIISHEQSLQLRRSATNYAKHVLHEEMSHDVTLIARRMGIMASQVNDSKFVGTDTQRAVSVAPMHMSAVSLRHTFAALNERFDVFSKAVADRIVSDGETAATLRWKRAADRFVRMQGISEDVDRVLLKDIVESAIALGKAGVVSNKIVDGMIASATAQTAISAKTALPQKNLSSDGQVKFEVLADMAMSSGVAGIVNQIISRVEQSVGSVVGSMQGIGASQREIANIVAGVRQLSQQVQSGKGQASMVQTAGLVESLCDKLDEFAQVASSAVIAHEYDDIVHGYEDLSAQGIFVSVSGKEDVVSSASVQAGVKASAEQMRQSLEQVHSRAFTQIRQSLLAQVKENAAKIGSNQVSAIARISSAKSVQELEEAHRAVAQYVTQEQQAQMTRSLEAIKRGEMQIHAFEKQERMIVNAARVASELRASIRSGAVAIAGAPVVVDHLKIHTNYLQSLGNSLATYARLAEDYRRGIQSTLQASDLVGQIGMVDSRLERMLMTVKPESSHADMAEVGEAFETSHGEIHFGYNDIVDIDRSQVRNYPSSDRISDLTAILGVQKAIRFHAQEIGGGKAGNVEALGQAVSRLVLEQGAFAGETVVNRLVDANGELVNVKVSPSGQMKQTYALRQNIAQAHMPETLRKDAATSAISVDLSVSRPERLLSVSGAGDFVPVIAGAMLNGSGSENRGYVAEDANGDLIKVAKDRHGTISDEHVVISSDDMINRIAGHLGVHENRVDGQRQIQLSVGGVNFNMTSADYVQMLARPIVESASWMAPSLTNAQNVLFSGYASMLGQSDRRTLASLRRAYIDSLGRAGEHSAHGELGLNTKTFAKLLGNPVSNISAVRDASRTVSYELSDGGLPTFLSTQDIRSSSGARGGLDLNLASGEMKDRGDAVAKSLSDAVVKRMVPVMSVGASNDFSWVSNAINMRAGVMHGSVNGRREQSQDERQVLAKIDNMLDYVEHMSERNVGVFSSDETVRVLLEALPEEGRLGNKGLPKWRQKENRTSRAEEARKLREALAKIGANPIQGTQAFANKQYVSPNLIAGGQASAPLFSGGSDGNTAAPSAASHASDVKSNAMDTASVSEEDLQFLVDELKRMLFDSLNEELQRRRSE